MIFLLADDSRPTRNLLKSYIMDLRLGHTPEFIEVEKAEDILTILQTKRVDFIFLDWFFNTPMTGLDVLQELRNIVHFKQLPVIMVTCASDKDNVIIALKAGANDFIVKPIDQKIFIKKTMQVINSVRYA